MASTYPQNGFSVELSSNCLEDSFGSATLRRWACSKVVLYICAYSNCCALFFVSIRSFCEGRTHVEGRMNGAYMTTSGMISSMIKMISANGMSLFIKGCSQLSCILISPDLLEYILIAPFNKPCLPARQRRSTILHALFHCLCLFTIAEDEFDTSEVEFLAQGSSEIMQAKRCTYKELLGLMEEPSRP